MLGGYNYTKSNHFALEILKNKLDLLTVTVFFTCIPIPLMKINSWWYFAMISISGL
jgi:hypothetical protein